jgi:hypothetical protein
MGKKSENAKAGEAGQQGRDRQPQTASQGKVKSRSVEAREGMKNKAHERSDMVHPGPNREEGERSKGDVHHNQHEHEKEMNTEGL